MKMKSKFFGLNAKLALAVLAVGTMFASCYDSENGDVTVPYQAPDPVYTFVGTVNDNATNGPVAGATVTLSGAVVGTATTDEQGGYQIVHKGAINGTVTVTVAAKEGEYEAASESFDVVSIEKGQSITYYKNLLVNYTDYLPEYLKVSAIPGMYSDNSTLQGENPDGDNYIAKLDIINETNEPMILNAKFVVKSGIRVSEDTDNFYVPTKAWANDAIADIKAYIRGELEVLEDPTYEFGREEKDATIVLAPRTALKSVVISYTYATRTFDFSYASESARVKTEEVLSVAIKPVTVGIDHYHGHGHGHGDDLNAGGGIVDPEL